MSGLHVINPPPTSAPCWVIPIHTWGVRLVQSNGFIKWRNKEILLSTSIDRDYSGTSKQKPVNSRDPMECLQVNPHHNIVSSIARMTYLLTGADSPISLVFHCLSIPERQARVVSLNAHDLTAYRAVSGNNLNRA